MEEINNYRSIVDAGKKTFLLELGHFVKGLNCLNESVRPSLPAGQQEYHCLFVTTFALHREGFLLCLEFLLK